MENCCKSIDIIYKIVHKIPAIIPSIVAGEICRYRKFMKKIRAVSDSPQPVDNSSRQANFMLK
jgi:hypothetical protein